MVPIRTIVFGGLLFLAAGAQAQIAFRSSASDTSGAATAITYVGAGAEDDAYANAPVPYRTSGTLLSEVSELRAIGQFSAAT